jgi:hypothetical protein
MNAPLFHFFVVFILFSFCLESCKKEQAPTPTPTIENPLNGADLSHLEGNYLCQKIGYFSVSINSITTKDTNDLIISSSVQDSILTVFGHTFKIRSPTQTSFSNDETSSYSGIVKLRRVIFSNNYNNISLTYYNNDGYRQDDIYTGTKTSLAPILLTNPYLDTLVGLYLLNVRRYDLQTGLDTNYTDTLSVSYNVYDYSYNYEASIIVENKRFAFSNFYSTAKRFHFYSNNTEPRIENSSINWQNGVLNLKYHIKSDSTSPSNPEIDAYYQYDGNKL